MRYLPAIVMIMLLIGCQKAQEPVQPVPEPAVVTPSGTPVQPKVCPSCDDGNNCTVDFCGENTSFACQYTALAPCCGNNDCQLGETHESCPADCIACTAGKCEKASFDYAAKKCMTKPQVPCCGNGVCEPFEESCEGDCPKCETSEKCRTAVRDSATGICAVKPIVPCCGNDICDRGETCASCSADCRCEEGIDLGTYPTFLKDGTKIVVGDNGTSRDVLTASSMTTALASQGVDTESNVLKLFSSSALKSADLIVLGGPCENALWEEYQGVECSTGFIKPNRAIVKLVITSGREIVYVAGYSATDTQRAAEALNNHNKYDFDGMEVELDTSGATAKII